jgi:hypothetical protein
LVAEVNVYSRAMAGSMAHTEVTWGKAPPVRRAAVRQLGLENRHERVIAAASDLFSDKHYQSAVAGAVLAVVIAIAPGAQSGRQSKESHSPSASNAGRGSNRAV